MISLNVVEVGLFCMGHYTSWVQVVELVVDGTLHKSVPFLIKVVYSILHKYCVCPHTNRNSTDKDNVR